MSISDQSVPPPQYVAPDEEFEKEISVAEAVHQVDEVLPFPKLFALGL